MIDPSHYGASIKMMIITWQVDGHGMACLREKAKLLYSFRKNSTVAWTLLELSSSQNDKKSGEKIN